MLPAIFAGAAMTATSIGITASVLGELKVLRTREGQMVIGAAVLDDILGILILAVVVALAAGEGFTAGPVVRHVGAASVFVAVALALSRTAAPAFDALLDRLLAPGEVAVAAGERLWPGGRHGRGSGAPAGPLKRGRGGQGRSGGEALVSRQLPRHRGTP